jgi:hypothetical protein
MGAGPRLVRRWIDALFGSRAPSGPPVVAARNWSKVDWAFVMVCPERWAFEIVPGVNPWDRDWTTVTTEDGQQVYVDVVDPSYGQRHRLGLWSLNDPRLPVFAAGEFSNGMYAFYLPAGAVRQDLAELDVASDLVAETDTAKR